MGHACPQGDASVEDMSNEAMDTGDDGAHGPRAARLASATGPSHAAAAAGAAATTPATGSKAAPAHTNATGDDGGAAPTDTAGTAHCTALSGAQLAQDGRAGPSEEEGQEGQAETEMTVGWWGWSTALSRDLSSDCVLAVFMGANLPGVSGTL